MSYVTTEKMGELIGIKATSIRAAYCQNGSYFGIIPTKMPNGRLMWDLEKIENFIRAAA